MLGVTLSFQLLTTDNTVEPNQLSARLSRQNAKRSEQN